MWHEGKCLFPAIPINESLASKQLANRICFAFVNERQENSTSYYPNLRTGMALLLNEGIPRSLPIS